MSNFPNSLDDDSTLSMINDNLTSIGGLAINQLRDAMFAVEANIGILANGSAGSIAQRLNVSLNPDGTIMPSALAGIGLVYLPITNSQVSPTAGIQESKLSLTYSTSYLYNLYQVLRESVDVLNGFLSLVGIKLEPHIDGTNYNHDLSAILVDSALPMLKTNPVAGSQAAGTNVISRNTTNADYLVNDISNDLVVHEKADGTSDVTAASGGTVPPLDFAHNASGIYVNPDAFTTIPQSNDNAQSIFDYIDNSSNLLIGSRIDNFYTNGVSRTSRSSVLTNDGYGQNLIPPTPATAYFLNVPPGPTSSSPVDSFINGDDIIQFNPTSAQLSTFNFDAQFAQVEAGDLLTINYGTGISYQFYVDSVKSIINGSNRTYAVRINGTNIAADGYFDGYASARIDKTLFNRNKYGVLASAGAPNSLGVYESLIFGNPRGAIALGNGFNASFIDATHFNLYLTLLPNGDLTNIFPLPAIDVSGNQGTTPGAYTLNGILENINAAFRAPGFNYRFIAFSYNGQIGIMLADSYNNSSFTIIAGIVNASGSYTSSSNVTYPNNIVDNFNNIDAFGFGLLGANVASPPPAVSYSTINAAVFAPTLVFCPLKRNYYYVNGAEKDKLYSDPLSINNIQDSNGDGYYPATISTVNVLANRVQTTYTVNLNLDTSGLIAGKTLVVQPIGGISTTLTTVNYGRFIIESVSFSGICDTSSAFTNITVYDSVHGVGSTPFATLPVGTPVNLYFSDDSVQFDAENVADATTSGPYKRFFEVYVDGIGVTNTHERARFINAGNGISNINFIKVSPKLKGYNVGVNNRQIRLTISAYDATTGDFSGFLSQWNGSVTLNPGPITSGKKGEVVRFYDDTNIDFIDFAFDLGTVINTFGSSESIDIQLFTSLQLDQNFMLLSTCQVSDTTKSISHLNDARQFGNVSEDILSSSAINYISAPQKLLNENGAIRGFDDATFTNNTIFLNGGVALISGQIVFFNNQNISLPNVIEVLYPAFTTSIATITWFICANSAGEYEIVANTDHDPFNFSYGVLDQNRIFYVKNGSGTPYSVRSGYLDEIVNSYKDLTVLYVATSTAGTISSLKDCRRFVSSGYSGLKSSVLSTTGNFRTLEAADTYFSQLNNFISSTLDANNNEGAQVIVSGVNTISESLTLNYLNPVTFKGNAGTLTFSSAITLTNNIIFDSCNLNFGNTVNLGSNITFKNCTINTSAAVANGFNLGSSGNSNIIFDGCTINYDYDASSDVGFILANPGNTTNGCIIGAPGIVGITNFAVNNCTLTTPFIDHYPFITFNFSVSSSFMQQVSINNNTINNKSGSGDFYAAVAFVAPTTSSTSVNGPRLIDCTINNNTCSNDQLLMISAPVNGSHIIEDVIVPINVNISGNTCGAINILVKQDIQYNTLNTNYIKNQEASITISRNTCRYIYNGFSTGLIVDSIAHLPCTDMTTGLFSASMTISYNTVSWIHLGTRAPTSTAIKTSDSMILENKMNAYLASWLVTYWGATTPLNIAIYCQEVKGS